MKTFEDCLNKIAQDNDWDDWRDVQNHASFARTREDIMTEAHDMFVSQIANVLSYDDKDEDQKLQEIKQLIEK